MAADRLFRSAWTKLERLRKERGEPLILAANADSPPSLPRGPTRPRCRSPSRLPRLPHRLRRPTPAPVPPSPRTRSRRWWTIRPVLDFSVGGPSRPGISPGILSPEQDEPDAEPARRWRTSRQARQPPVETRSCGLWRLSGSFFLSIGPAVRAHLTEDPLSAPVTDTYPGVVGHSRADHPSSGKRREGREHHAGSGTGPGFAQELSQVGGPGVDPSRGRHDGQGRQHLRARPRRGVARDQGLRAERPGPDRHDRHGDHRVHRHRHRAEGARGRARGGGRPLRGAAGPRQGSLRRPDQRRTSIIARSWRSPTWTRSWSACPTTGTRGSRSTP